MAAVSFDGQKGKEQTQRQRERERERERERRRDPQPGRFWTGKCRDRAELRHSDSDKKHWETASRR